MRTICFRTTPLKYCLSKVVVTFLSGGAALAMATALFIAFFAIQPEIYMVNPNEIPYYVMNGGLTGLTIYGVKGALLFFACRILLIFMYGGMNELLVEHTESICPGQIGIFVADGEGLVKEYQPDGLHSHNPKYPVRHFTDDDNVRCVGRVLGKIERGQYASPDDIAIYKDSKRKARI